MCVERFIAVEAAAIGTIPRPEDTLTVAPKGDLARWRASSMLRCMGAARLIASSWW
jgi:hypothetical protein